MVAGADRDRLGALDGLRGIAIILVVLYHYFSRWAPSHGEPLYPYGDAFAGLPLAADGFVGVYLFFIISGFVIFRSLKRSASPFKFAIKRADRLFLPMLILSAVSFLLLAGPLKTAFFEVRPADLLPSWTFSAPAFWRWVDPDVGYVDGVYWTLFVEVRFYAMMAILWFVLPQKASAPAIVAVAVVSVLLGQISGPKAFGQLLDLIAFPHYIALFAAGVVYSEMREAGPKRWHIASLVALIPASLIGMIGAPEMVVEPWHAGLWILGFHAIFVALALRSRWTYVFEWRALRFIGGLSYSLYLLHQRLGVAIIARLPIGLPPEVYLLAVMGIFGMMIALAYLSYRLLETQKPFSKILSSHRP